MQLSEITFDSGRPVDGYGPNFFRIAGEVFEGMVAVLPQSCGPWSGFEDSAPFVAVAKDLDVVFVGTGANIAHIPAEFRTALETAGIGVETTLLRLGVKRDWSKSSNTDGNQFANIDA